MGSLFHAKHWLEACTLCLKGPDYDLWCSDCNVVRQLHHQKQGYTYGGDSDVPLHGHELLGEQSCQHACWGVQRRPLLKAGLQSPSPSSTHHRADGQDKQLASTGEHEGSLAQYAALIRQRGSSLNHSKKTEF